MIEYRNIADLNQTILDNLHKVPRDIDLVVGIPRSGLLVANMLALRLNLPLTDLNGLIEGHLLEGGRRFKSNQISSESKTKLKVLILDDSIQSGREMKKVKAQIDAASMPHEIIFGAVYASPEAAEAVDIYFEILSPWRLFEWNIMHHSILERSCVDLDGVLCRDPTEEQNDDGPAYADFLANAKPLFIPGVAIGWLVTCRLEKYRELTEQWLTKHGVIYRQLIMMDLPSKAARIAAGSHGKFKADVYKKTGAKLFIESSARQAREVFVRTGKQVFCIETWQMENQHVVVSIRNNIDIIFHWGYRGARGVYRRLRRLVRAIGTRT